MMTSIDLARAERLRAALRAVANDQNMPQTVDVSTALFRLGLTATDETLAAIVWSTLEGTLG